MAELIAWYDEAARLGALHPLIASGSFAVVFVAIQPFQDGNRRLSRVLTTVLLPPWDRRNAG